MARVASDPVLPSSLPLPAPSPGRTSASDLGHAHFASMLDSREPAPRSLRADARPQNDTPPAKRSAPADSRRAAASDRADRPARVDDAKPRRADRSDRAAAADPADRTRTADRAATPGATDKPVDGTKDAAKDLAKDAAAEQPVVAADMQQPAPTPQPDVALPQAADAPVASADALAATPIDAKATPADGEPVLLDTPAAVAVPRDTPEALSPAADPAKAGGPAVTAGGPHKTATAPGNATSAGAATATDTAEGDATASAGGPAGKGETQTFAQHLAKVDGADEPAKPATPDTQAPPRHLDAFAAVRAGVEAVQSLTQGAPSHFAPTTPLQAAHAAAAASPAAQTPATPSQPVPIAGVGVEIAAQVAAGKNRFEIRLDPPELGRIDVRLEVDKEGNVTSRLTVERIETLDLLRRDAQQLERAFQQAGLKTSDNTMQFSLRDQGQQAQQDRSGPHHASAATSDDGPAPLDLPRHRASLRLGGLDISI